MVTRQVVVSFWIGLGLSAFFEPGFGGTVSLPPSLSLSGAVYLLFFRRLSPPCCLNAERCARGPEPGEGATAFHFSSSRCASTVATAF